MRSRKPGVWELVVDLGRDPLTGRRRQRSKTFHGTKREASRALRSLLDDVEQGRLTGTATTVSDLLERWTDHAQDNLSPTTLREYRRLIDKRIAPALGPVPLIKLTTPQLDDFYLALSREAGLSPGSVRQVHSIIRRSLRQAVKWGWIEHNPAVNATPPRLRQKEIQPPSIAMIRSILVDADRYDPSFGVLVRLAVATGLRRAELCGLQWDDVGFDRRLLRVRRSAVATAGGVTIKDTKTGETRKLTLDPTTVALLETHHGAMADRAREAAERLHPDAFVFSHALDGSRPLHPDNVTSAFRRLPSHEGRVRLHDLRHAHATQLLAAGVDINTVSSRLGHANTSTTLNIYADALDEKDQDAADVIGDLLGDDAA